MSGVRLQTRIVYGLDLVVGNKVLSYLHGAAAVAVHPHLESLEASHEEISFIRSDYGACHVFDAYKKDIFYGLSVTDDCSCQQIAVTVEILGSRVYYDVSSELKWSLQIRRTECVVAYYLDLRVVIVSDLSCLSDICDLEVRIGQGLNSNTT